jgi:hypothetical protein
MAVTLLEASKINSGDVKRAAIIEMFAANSDVLRVLPFEDIIGGSFSYNQEGTLPGVAFRGFNEAYPESVGVLNPQTEVLRIAGGDLDVDKALIKTRGPAVRTQHEGMKVKAMSLYLAGKVINGDSTIDPRQFDGLRVRIVGNQIIPANLVSPSNNSPLSLSALDKAIDLVDSPNALVMSKAMRRRLTAAARTIAVGGDIDFAEDEFGRRVTMYNDLPILIADYDDTGARIIDYNEAGPAGSAVSTSIYVVNFGDGMVSGLQNGAMEVTDLGEINAKPVLRTRVEWLVGLAIMHGRAAARVWGITDAAVTA